MDWFVEYPAFIEFHGRRPHRRYASHQEHTDRGGDAVIETTWPQCPRCGFEGPHSVIYDDNVAGYVVIVACGSAECHVEFTASDADDNTVTG